MNCSWSVHIESVMGILIRCRIHPTSSLSKNFLFLFTPRVHQCRKKHDIDRSIVSQYDADILIALKFPNMQRTSCFSLCIKITSKLSIALHTSSFFPSLLVVFDIFLEPSVICFLKQLYKLSTFFKMYFFINFCSVTLLLWFGVHSYEIFYILFVHCIAQSFTEKLSIDDVSKVLANILFFSAYQKRKRLGIRSRCMKVL